MLYASCFYLHTLSPGRPQKLDSKTRDLWACIDPVSLLLYPFNRHPDPSLLFRTRGSTQVTDKMLYACSEAVASSLTEEER